MSDNLTFSIHTHTVRYGDNLAFVEYQIFMLRSGKIAGVEQGPHRTTPTRSGALTAAHRRIKELKSHRLFPITITRKHISDGVARDCHRCAISKALLDNKERMGLGLSDEFKVNPYGCFTLPEGIVLYRRGTEDVHIPVEHLPDIIAIRAAPNGRFYPDSMIEWAMNFDAWSEVRHMTMAEWREERGSDEDMKPGRPYPASFVLDLDAMVPCVD